MHDGLLIDWFSNAEYVLIIIIGVIKLNGDWDGRFIIRFMKSEQFKT